MQRISLSQAFAQWQELAADIPQDDAPMLAESWNDYTDSLCKDGALCDLQYHYAPVYRCIGDNGESFDYTATAWQSGGAFAILRHA